MGAKLTAPARIYATVNGSRLTLPSGDRYLIGGWEERDHQSGSATGYVKADIADTLRSRAAALVDRNCTYDGGNIIIPCGSHNEAIRLMADLRASLTEEQR